MREVVVWFSVWLLCANEGDAKSGIQVSPCILLTANKSVVCMHAVNRSQSRRLSLTSRPELEPELLPEPCESQAQQS